MATSARALASTRRRLGALAQQAAQGRPPTVAQISASYAHMAAQDNDDEWCWGTLLALAKHAIGVLDECCECHGSGTVSGQGTPECPKCGGTINVRTGYLSCTCNAGVVIPKGFARVPCPTCNGSGQRRIHNPAPAELPGNLGPERLPIAKARADRRMHYYLMQQVVEVLQTL